MSNVNSQTSLPPEGIGAAVAADTTLARIKKNLQDCHDCVLDVLNQDTTTTTVARTVRARSVVGQLNSGHFFTTYVVDVIGAGGCGQPTAHPQNKSQQTNKTNTYYSSSKLGPRIFHSF